MMRLVWFELVKTLPAGEPISVFVAFGLIVPLIVTGLKMGGQHSFERLCCRTTSSSAGMF